MRIFQMCMMNKRHMNNLWMMSVIGKQTPILSGLDQIGIEARQLLHRYVPFEYIDDRKGREKRRQRVFGLFGKYPELLTLGKNDVQYLIDNNHILMHIGRCLSKEGCGKRAINLFNVERGIDRI